MSAGGTVALHSSPNQEGPFNIFQAPTPASSAADIPFKSLL